MKLSKAIEGYTIAKLADGFSENTINGYKTHYAQLIKFVGDVEVSKITSTQLSEFILYLRQDYKPRRLPGDESPYKTTTIRNAWCAVRSLFGWLNEEIHLERPDLDLHKPQVSYPEIKPYSEEDIRKMIKVCEEPLTIERNGGLYQAMRRAALRDKALVLFLLDTGVRASECAQVRVKDLDIEEGSVTIRPVNSSRKNKARIIKIGRVCKKALWRYYQLRGGLFPTDPVFLTVEERAMNRNSIRMAIRKIGKAAGVDDCYPHRFRHTFAIQFLRNGGDVFSLQYILGHTDSAMTRHYLSLADMDITAAHHMASPADRWRL